MPKALFVQYTDPAGYPPIQHSMAMLERDGWTIASVGTRIKVTSDLRMPPRQNFKTYLMRAVSSGRIARKIHYIRFCVLVVFVALRWRPDLIYVSDMIATPAGLLAHRLTRSSLLYHEHDSPNTVKNWVERMLWRCRRAACRLALRSISPNARRSKLLAEQTGVDQARVLTVFNCPLRSEALSDTAVDRDCNDAPKFWLYYHGSIVPDRLPLAVVDALGLLPPNVCLRIVGYETPGATGHLDAIKRRAGEQSVLDRIDMVGPVSRFALHQFARDSHLGLSLMPLASDDVNMVHMVGASNKPFDYLANGCPLIVSDLPDWRHMFVDAGIASSCNPASAQSISDAVQCWLLHHDAYRKAQHDGIKMVSDRWNYEAQFEPVMAALRTNTKYDTPVHIPI
jgi:glycosyltransferase involved in cell wall biosynthesis